MPSNAKVHKKPEIFVYFCRKNNGMKDRCGIVFVHGIVGNNKIFDFLMPLIPDGYMVKAVALAGHGGNALSFSRTSMDVWKRQVADAVAEMGKLCDNVVAVGHSMGCLLLLEEALKGNVSALFLLNPPLKLSIKPRMLVNAIKVTIGLTDNDVIAKAAKEAYGISLDPNPLHYYGWPMRYLELFAEISRIRKSMARGINCKVTAVVAERDEMVSIASADCFKKIPDANVIMLADSHHYYYSDSDREIISNAFSEFTEHHCCPAGRIRDH